MPRLYLQRRAACRARRVALRPRRESRAGARPRTPSRPPRWTGSGCGCRRASAGAGGCDSGSACQHRIGQARGFAAEQQGVAVGERGIGGASAWRAWSGRRRAGGPARPGRRPGRHARSVRRTRGSPGRRGAGACRRVRSRAGRTRCSVAPVFAHRRITLPVLGGISGRCRMTCSIRALSGIRAHPPVAGDFSPARARARLGSLRARQGCGVGLDGAACSRDSRTVRAAARLPGKQHRAEGGEAQHHADDEQCT